MAASERLEDELDRRGNCRGGDKRVEIREKRHRRTDRIKRNSDLMRMVRHLIEAAVLGECFSDFPDT